MDELIERCRPWFVLEPSDFKIIDEELTLDGMPADQWVDAMTEG